MISIPTLLKRGWMLIVLGLLFMSSCTVEKQLAQSFLQGWNPPALMLIPPPILLKENLKSADPPVEGSDSLQFTQNVALSEVNDSTYLDEFVNAMITALRRQGYLVFMPAALDTFLTYTGDAYVLDMAQVLVEEYDVPVTEKAVFDEMIYYKKFMLNTIGVSSWFELSRMNVLQDDRRLLFASHKISDQLKGKFSQHPFTGEVLFHYTLNPIILEDVYTLAAALGTKYASHLTDFFINRHIAANLPEGTSPDSWYHLDPRTGKLYRNWEDFFIELDPE